jgi:tRNA(fMet)-specific endonuclease VapC
LIVVTPNQITKDRILVDTDVFSYLTKGDTRAEFFKPFLLNKKLALSFVTVAELYYWAYFRNWSSTKIVELEAKIKNYVILPYDYSLCQAWADTRAQCEKVGHHISDDNDCWIGATALLHDCALATNNGRHFRYINGLELICPGLI